MPTDHPHTHRRILEKTTPSLKSRSLLASPLSKSRKLPAVTHESMGFVITHTPIADRLGLHAFKLQKTYPVVVTFDGKRFDKKGGLEELEKIKAEMKKIILENPLTREW